MRRRHPAPEADKRAKRRRRRKYTKSIVACAIDEYEKYLVMRKCALIFLCLMVGEGGGEDASKVDV